MTTISTLVNLFLFQKFKKIYVLSPCKPVLQEQGLVSLFYTMRSKVNIDNEYFPMKRQRITDYV